MSLLESYKKKKHASTFFFFFSIYFLSLRPLLIFFGLDVIIPSYEFMYDFYPDIAKAHLIILVWVVLIVVFSKFSEPKNEAIRNTYKIEIINLNLLIILTTLISLMGAIFTSYFIIKFGSLSEFLYQVKIEKAMQGMYIFREVSSWALILSGLIFLYAKLSRNYFKTTIALGLIVINSAFIFSWGNRTTIGFFLFMLGLFYFTTFIKFKFTKVILSVVILVVVANGLRFVREDLHSEAINHEVNSLENMGAVTALSLSMHLSEYDGLVLASRDVGKRFDYRYGEDFANGFFAWIPRFLWPDKPQTHNTGLWFRQVYESEKRNGWPITAVGDFYVNGSWFLVIFGAILNAFLLAILNKLSHKSLIRDYLIITFSVFVLGQGIDTGFIQTIFLKFIPVVLVVLALKIQLSDTKHILDSAKIEQK
ncbi:oligosaccharide repeat unit polymerase [Alteromonas sp. NFXS44]|uniref:oligosaccharide repeat unit polymerase n=1 Tax=Alteromonas sp. NFXS44 TaxID=2818435 RepID=UPI0032DE9678